MPNSTAPSCWPLHMITGNDYYSERVWTVDKLTPFFLRSFPDCVTRRFSIFGRAEKPEGAEPSLNRRLTGSPDSNLEHEASGCESLSEGQSHMKMVVAPGAELDLAQFSGD